MKKVFAILFVWMLIMAMPVMAFAEEAAPVPETVVDAAVDYWFIGVAALAVLAVVVILIIKFIRTPHNAQLEKIKGWLLWVVMKAEAEFGSKTGQLKLSYVYDLFVGRFPWLAKIVPFNMFSQKVDEALDIMRELLEKDPELLEKVPAGGIIVEEIAVEKAEEEKTE